ncbi:hypothetical protein PUNSTDRAFT_53314 [Punctularia strigosozonata HHB-11173 SS5]|uniref:uncharacterized protein n=1 Tax=Punctularia strigosozonata (strain HHB-11173) TaxID=741275 RepID=UPI0004417578|nr:uncharacterized protein PUNSTDRAFT_53314 [Punctularia strigosozonata HHB-11173 SS5]EIN08010.1 hypothetical protein PUNSTDRAFT_53314 [Punctularia strigosozonata HHB-11173 SS5]
MASHSECGCSSGNEAEILHSTVSLAGASVVCTVVYQQRSVSAQNNGADEHTRADSI